MKMRRWIAGLCAGGVLVFASAASAADLPYYRLGSLLDASADGTPVHQQRIAVNRDSGRLYVADPVGDQVRVFDATADGASEGTPFGAGDLTDPVGVAVDQETGAVYVSDATHVLKYAADGTPDVLFTSPVGVTGPLAFDQSADRLVVADTATNTIKGYSPLGLAPTSFDGSDNGSAFTALQDVAAAPDGDLYIVDADGDPATAGHTSRVERYSAAGQREATVGPVTGAATITVNAAGDRVVVSGNQGAVDGSAGNDRPTISIFDTSDLSTPVEQVPTDPSLQWSTIRGLAVGSGDAARLYVATDVDVAYGGSYGHSSLQLYQRPTQAPGVTTAKATKVSDIDAKLNGTVNPNNAATAYWFEYGPTTSYGSSIPVAHDADAGSGATPVTVSRQILDLAPGATYHYRLVARSAVGTTNGPDRQFTTSTGVAEEPVADTCPNAAIRAQQSVQRLPDCQAYELVSPADKAGGSVAFPTNLVGYFAGRLALTDASSAGSSLIFWGYNAFADPKSGIPSNYRSTRTDNGWSTVQASPPSALAHPGIEDTATFADVTDDHRLAFSETAQPYNPLDHSPWASSAGNPRDVYTVGADGTTTWMSRPSDGSASTSSATLARYRGRTASGDWTFFQTRDHLTPRGADRRRDARYETQVSDLSAAFAARRAHLTSRARRSTCTTRRSARPCRHR